MADPNFNVEYRLNDSDNNILRKLLNNVRALIAGTSSLTVTEVTPASPAAASLTEGSKTVASTATPEALGTGSFRQVMIYPLRSNSGTTYWGTTSTNDTQHGTLPVTITAAPGKAINISGIFIDVSTNGDGVRYIGLN